MTVSVDEPRYQGRTVAIDKCDAPPNRGSKGIVTGDSRDPAVVNSNRRRHAATAVEGQDVGIVENCAGRGSLRGHASAKPQRRSLTSAVVWKERRYWATDFGVASMRLTTIFSRSSISGILGAISFFQVSLS
jgi:hypothetical protein